MNKHEKQVFTWSSICVVVGIACFVIADMTEGPDWHLIVFGIGIGAGIIAQDFY